MTTVLVDVDSVVANLMPVWLELYNKQYDDCLLSDDITQWELHEIVKPECGTHIYDYLEDDSLYDAVLPVDGAISGVNWLRTHSYDVRFVTSGVHFGKALWLMRWGFTKGENPRYSPDLIICHDKFLVKGDIMIDDNPRNLNSFDGLQILFSQPWNYVTTSYYRADNWPDVIQYLARKNAREI